MEQKKERLKTNQIYTFFQIYNFPFCKEEIRKMLTDGPNLDTLFVFLTVFTPPQSSYETAETLVSSVTLPCPLLDSQ